MNLDIKIINSELSINCFFEKNFIKKTFHNSFSLETLKNQANIFRIFSSVEQILHEIINKNTDEKDYIIGNEESSNSIELKIPIPLNVYNKMSFILNEEVKATNQSLNEYMSAVNKFEYQFGIKDFNSEILSGLNIEKSAIKSWISPFERIEARLLYSFHSITYINNNQKIFYNPGYDSKVSDFHNTCGFIKNILIICKSKNEIFGGYTPLYFIDSDGYEKDNDSFLFSLNNKNKYGKKTRNFSNSIFHNKNNGPCFCRDLFFIENSMNKVKFGKDELFTIEEYSTEKNWVNKNNCNTYKDYVILDALEIFQIVKRQYDFNELSIDINNSQNNIHNISMNHNNQVNINNNSRNRSSQNNVNNNNQVNINNNSRNRSSQNNVNNNQVNINNNSRNRSNQNNVNNNNPANINNNSRNRSGQNNVNNNQVNINNNRRNRSGQNNVNNNQVNINNNRRNRSDQNNVNNNNQVNISNNRSNRSDQNIVNNNTINNQSQSDNNNNNNQDNINNNNNLDNRNNIVNNNIITDNYNINNNNPHNNFENENLSDITQISDNDNNDIIQDNIFDFINITIENNEYNQEADPNLFAIEENRINNAKRQNNTFCSFKKRLNISSGQNTS